MITMLKASKVSCEQGMYVAGPTQQCRRNMNALYAGRGNMCGCVLSTSRGKVGGSYTGRTYFEVALEHHLRRLSWNLQVQQ